jgi:hypothetical protein
MLPEPYTNKPFMWAMLRYGNLEPSPTLCSPCTMNHSKLSILSHSRLVGANDHWQLPTHLSCLMLVLSAATPWCPINLRPGFAPPTPSSRGPRAPRRSIKRLLPPDGAGCSTAVDCVPELVLMELPPSAVGLQLPLAQPAMTSCLREQDGGNLIAHPA